MEGVPSLPPGLPILLGWLRFPGTSLEESHLPASSHSRESLSVGETKAGFSLVEARA